MSTKAFLVLCCALTVSCTARAPMVDSCFTPGGNCLSAAVAEILKAKSEIVIQAYSLNAKPIADALVKAKDARVKVEIVLDKGSGAAQNNAFYFSTLNGIPTYLDARHAVADSNFIVIDNGTLVASSSAFEKSEPDRNAGNMLIVRSASVAGSYRAKWEEHKAHAEAFVAAPGTTARQEPAVEKKRVKKKKKTK